MKKIDGDKLFKMQPKTPLHIFCESVTNSKFECSSALGEY